MLRTNRKPITEPNLHFAKCTATSCENGDGTIFVKLYPEKVVLMERGQPALEFLLEVDTIWMQNDPEVNERAATILGAALPSITDQRFIAGFVTYSPELRYTR